MRDQKEIDVKITKYVVVYEVAGQPYMADKLHDTKAQAIEHFANHTGWEWEYTLLEVMEVSYEMVEKGL